LSSDDAHANTRAQRQVGKKREKSNLAPKKREKGRRSGNPGPILSAGREKKERDREWKG